MQEFFLGNVSLFLGVLFSTLVIAIRALARDTQLLDDLRSALTSYLSFLLFKTVLMPFDSSFHDHPLYKAGVVVWMLCFAFGTVRTFRPEVQDLIRIGAYVRGSNAQVDKAIELMPRVEKFLKQDVGERSTFDQTRQGLFQLANEWKF